MAAFVTMASNLTISCESVTIFYFHLENILQDRIINKNISKFYTFTKYILALPWEKIVKNQTIFNSEFQKLIWKKTSIIFIHKVPLKKRLMRLQKKWCYCSYCLFPEETSDIT